MVDENQMEQGAPIPTQAEEKARHAVAHACESAEDLRSAAGAMADKYQGYAEGVWDDARRRVRNLQDESKQYVRENPTKAVFIALCAGFVVALISFR